MHIRRDIQFLYRNVTLYINNLVACDTGDRELHLVFPEPAVDEAFPNVVELLFGLFPGLVGLHYSGLCLPEAVLHMEVPVQLYLAHLGTVMQRHTRFDYLAGTFWSMHEITTTCIQASLKRY